MLRLDPAYPPLWRTPTTLQFGAAPVAIVIDIEPWQERLVDHLEQGIADAALPGLAVALGAPPGAAELFIRRIQRALAAQERARPRVTLWPHEDAAPDIADVVAATLEDAGFETSWADAARLRDTTTPVVLLAHRLVEPHRAARLVSDDVPHIAIVFTGSGAEVGPFVRPGVSACFACLAAHRRDDDPLWPAVATQILRLSAPTVSVSLATEAAGAAAVLIASAEHQRSTSSPSLTLRAHSLRRKRHAHRPHAECGCRSLGESGMPIAAAARWPMSERAFARPA